MKMKIKVTFEDILDVEVEEQAYDAMLKHCSEIVETGDLTSFNFEEVKEDQPKEKSRVEYEIQLKQRGERYFVDVREDRPLPCGEIESEYIKDKEFTTREKAESEWRTIGARLETWLRDNAGGLVDYQNWIEETSEIVEILVHEGEVMHRAKTLVIKTSGGILSRLMDDYSDSGYMNANGGDIIIDLTYIEDDAEQLAHFFEVTGLTKADIEGLDYMGFYA